MLSTCYHCHARLGTNDALEALPIGRRIAYDGERGRVWVICTKCARWNLTPFEERWEALEQAERLYRGTRARVSTDNIALARVADGTELVRIGRPLRPEFAAWRYGREFLRRQRAHLRSPYGIASGVGLAASTAWVGWLVVAGRTGMPVGISALQSAGQLLTMGGLLAWQARGALRVQRTQPLADGRVLGLTRHDVWRSELSLTPDDALRVRFAARPVKPSGAIGRLLLGPQRVHAFDTAIRAELAGDDAIEWLRRALPYAHEDGASRAAVRDATGILGAAQDLSVVDLLYEPSSRERYRDGGRLALNLIGTPRRLALEMLLADGDEQRLAQGELAQLYARWEEAERIGRIADRLLVPSAIASRLRDGAAHTTPNDPGLDARE